MLERAQMSDFNKLIPTEQKHTAPEGKPPKACVFCNNEFPPRAVGPRWAEVCLSCKRDKYQKMIGFPKRYQSVNLDDCKITQGNSKAVEAVKAWINTPDHNLWFYGMPGTGKTYLASAAVRSGPICTSHFINVAMMLLDFQASVKDHDEREMISKYGGDSRVIAGSEDPIMLFDDVGAHRISDFGIEMFGLLLERFYSNDRTRLIFTSNLSPKEILDSMGERIASRLQGLAKPIKITGYDFRFAEDNAQA